MSAVAEGVETEALLEQLRDLGCDEAQGFFLAKPEPAAEIAAWLKRRAPRRIEELCTGPEGPALSEPAAAARVPCESKGRCITL
jgi:predicted signal transduction protein with EAL and GGDEF domain